MPSMQPRVVNQYVLNYQEVQRSLENEDQKGSGHILISERLVAYTLDLDPTHHEKNVYFSLLFCLGVTAYSSAQAFVYHPNNPNFGGNTFNYSWMLSSAQAQDKTKDPTATNDHSYSDKPLRQST